MQIIQGLFSLIIPTSLNHLDSPPGVNWGQSVGYAKEDIHRIEAELSTQQSDPTSLDKPFLCLHNFCPKIKLHPV